MNREVELDATVLLHSHDPLLPPAKSGGDRSVKIKSLEAAKIVNIQWLVLGCIETDFCNQIKSTR